MEYVKRFSNLRNIYPLFLFQPENKWSEAASDDEEQAVNVVITKDMSMEDVVKKILEMANK